MKNKFFTQEDILQLETIAAKYDISLEEMGKILTKKPNNMIQVRLSDNEIDLIDRAAQAKGMKRSTYCNTACRQMLCSGKFMNLNLTAEMREEVITKNTVKRTKVNICIKESDGYQEMVKASEYYDIPFAGLLRYFSLFQAQKDLKNF